MREPATPAVLRKTVWAGANLRSFPQASVALRMLSDTPLSAKQVRRITEQVGRDRLDERRRQVDEFRDRPLMERVRSAPSSAEVRPVDLVGVVMMDGGRYQRRDHFGEADYTGSHWKEDKVGLVLEMQGAAHEDDPCPEFPEWLAGAEVVRQIASLGEIERENAPVREAACGDRTGCGEAEPIEPADRPDGHRLSGKLLSREVIASSDGPEEFGWHLEQAAWRQGVVDAPRMAFVADGAGVNWTVHRRHFSQMTGVLDLMHALSYAWKAAKALDDPAAYPRYAAWIWQGRVTNVIDELNQRRPASRPSPPDDPSDPIAGAITYFTNHQQRMNYPHYRTQGLPLTSSHIESTIKLINLRVKGSEKFFRRDTGDALLQLRADSLSDSRPLDEFWNRWLQQQTGANTYRKQSA